MLSRWAFFFVVTYYKFLSLDRFDRYVILSFSVYTLIKIYGLFYFLIIYKK